MDVRVERLCQEEDDAVERLPESGGLGRACSRARALYSMSAAGSIHAPGPVVEWKCDTELHSDLRKICRFLIRECHRSHTCPKRDPLQVRVIYLLEPRMRVLADITSPLLRALSSETQ